MEAESGGARDDEAGDLGTGGDLDEEGGDLEGSVVVLDIGVDSPDRVVPEEEEGRGGGDAWLGSVRDGDALGGGDDDGGGASTAVTRDFCEI